VIVALITWLRVHPFLALLLGALTTGLVAGESGPDVVTSFAGGFGDTSVRRQTLKSWSPIERVLSVPGLGMVLLASLGAD
jgi:H+/gluconate symporter-like permease